jgi:YVTN family beta-propeller protein
MKKLISGIFLMAAAALLISSSSCGTASKPADTGNYTTGNYTTPWGMALDKDASHIYVANNLANSVSMINTSSMVIEKTIPTLCNPRNLVFNNDYTKLYVSHDHMSKCMNSQLTYDRKDDSWMSVIDMSQLKVVKEFPLKTSSASVYTPYYMDFDKTDQVIYLSDGANVAIVNAVTDTVAFILLSPPWPVVPTLTKGHFVTAQANPNVFALPPGGSVTSKLTCNVNDPINIPIRTLSMSCDGRTWVPQTPPSINPMTCTYTSANTYSPGCLVNQGDYDEETVSTQVAVVSLPWGVVPTRFRFDASRGLTYILDSTNSRISVKTHNNPLLGLFNDYTYNGQTDGYCAGTTNKKNGCDCAKDADCNSGACNLTAVVPYCKASSNGTVMSSSLNVLNSGTGVIRGSCNQSNKICTLIPTDSGDPNYITCTNAWDILPLSDGTMYVSCNGSSDINEKTKDQYILRLLVDKDGIASSNSSVISSVSVKLCPQITDLATDPSQTRIFAICNYDSTLDVLNAHTGEFITSRNIPGHPVRVIASDDYVFISTAAANEIIRYPISSLQ